jgi:hypothetical protein
MFATTRLAGLLTVAAVALSACGTAELAQKPAEGHGRTALIRGDIKFGPFGNATVRLQGVDGHSLSATERQAEVAPGPHTVSFSCKAVSRDASNSGELHFKARAGSTYDLKLRVLDRFPGCSAVLVLAGPDRVVAKPNALKHPPTLTQ